MQWCSIAILWRSFVSLSHCHLAPFTCLRLPSIPMKVSTMRKNWLGQNGKLMGIFNYYLRYVHIPNAKIFTFSIPFFVVDDFRLGQMSFTISAHILTYTQTPKIYVQAVAGKLASQFDAWYTFLLFPSHHSQIFSSRWVLFLQHREYHKKNRSSNHEMNSLWDCGRLNVGRQPYAHNLETSTINLTSADGCITAMISAEGTCEKRKSFTVYILNDLYSTIKWIMAFGAHSNLSSFRLYGCSQLISGTFQLKYVNWVFPVYL